MINVNDVNIAYDNFLKLFLIYYDECCRIQKVYLYNKKSKPWMTTSLKNACKERNNYTYDFLKRKLKKMK